MKPHFLNDGLSAECGTLRGDSWRPRRGLEVLGNTRRQLNKMNRAVADLCRTSPMIEESVDGK